MDLLQDLVTHLVGPWLFSGSAVRYLPGTVAQLLAAGDYATLLSPSALKEAWFGAFWAVIGPQVKTRSEGRVLPLLEGRVGAARVHDDAVVGEPVGGIVLEIGAGSGMWADVFARVKASSSSGQDGGARRRGRGGGRAGAITKIYGVEPNPASAAALRQRVRDVGLEGTYEVVPVGIEALNDPTAWAGRIEPGSVDCIVTVLCLCSIPEPEKNVRLLYDTLKKGGRWYVYEHVQTERGGLLMWLYQRLVNLWWGRFLGSCRLCRPTGRTLREVGPWASIDLEQPADEPAYQVVPHVLGTLTK